MQARTTTSPSRLGNRNCSLAFVPLYDDRPPRRLPGRAHSQRCDLEIDFETRKIRSGKKTVRLTPKEFDLLRYLVSHAGKPVPHRELLQAVWGPDYGDQTDYLRVFITHLRKKIEPNPAKPQYILTEPWIGYRFGN